MMGVSGVFGWHNGVVQSSSTANERMVWQCDCRDLANAQGYEGKLGIGMVFLDTD